MTVTWDRVAEPWRICFEQAWEARIAGSPPIGAVLANADGRVIARGRNRIAEARALAPLSGSRLGHAEIETLLAYAGQTDPPAQCTLYTSMEPCPMCLGAIRIHRLGRVRFAARDPVAGSSRLVYATSFMRFGNLNVSGPENAWLEMLMLGLLAEYGLGHEPGWFELADAWGPELAAALAFGRRLHDDDSVNQLAGSGTSAQDAYGRLCELR